MRKNICHWLFLIVLVIVSYNHYQFASTDNRNLLDFHEQIYTAAAFNNSQEIHAFSLGDNIPFYAKIIGWCLLKIDKSYFSLRMYYLFFLLVYLVAFYLALNLIVDTPFISLLAVLIQMSIPIMISYSRMCWPHMYGASFVLVAVLCLFSFMRNKKGKYFLAVLSLFFSYLSVKVYCTSIIYIGIISLWFCMINYKQILHGKKTLLFFCILIVLGSAVSFIIGDDILLLIEKGINSGYLSLFDFSKYQLMFLNRIHYLIFSLLLFISLIFLFFKTSSNIRKNMSLFVLFLFFTFIASYLTFPIDVTILGLLGACAVIAFFIGSLKHLYLKNVLVFIIVLFFIAMSFFQKWVMSYVYKPELFLYKTAILPDQRNWGRNDFKDWLVRIDKKGEKVLLFARPFYPDVGVNYIQPVDMNIMLENKIYNLDLFRPSDLYDECNINYLNSMSVDMISDAKINPVKFANKLKSNNIDYLIFEEVKNPSYWIFFDHNQVQFYDLFKSREELVLTREDYFSLEKISKFFNGKIKNNLCGYLFDVKFKYKYVKGYNLLNEFLRNNSLIKEVKRIKCAVKDIVIYQVID